MHWLDDVKKFVDKNWYQIVQDRDQLKEKRQAYIQEWVLIYCRKEEEGGEEDEEEEEEEEEEELSFNGSILKDHVCNR